LDVEIKMTLKPRSFMQRVFVTALVLATPFQYSQAQHRGRWPGKFQDGGYESVSNSREAGRSYDPNSGCQRRYVEGIDRRQRSVDPGELNSCEAGFEAGIRMAQRIGAGQGRVIGKLQGLSRGMDVAFEQTKNDPDLISQGRLSMTTAYFPSAESEAPLEAIGPAKQQANEDSYTRFRRAVDLRTEPDGRLKVPPVTVHGGQDGYSHDKKPIYSEEQFFQSEFNRRSDLSSYRSGDDYLDRNEIGQLSYWDVRNYRGDTGRFGRFSNWRNPESAWRAFLNSSFDAEYRRIRDGSHKEHRTQSATPITNAQTPGAPGDGGQGGKGGRGGGGDKQRPGGGGGSTPAPAPSSGGSSTQVEVDVTVPAAHYQSIFEESFRISYARAVESAFARASAAALEVGYDLGLSIGEAAGASYAMQSGLIQEYNDRYYLSWFTAYSNAYTSAYTAEFNNAFATRLNSTNLEIENVEIVGRVNDGILRSGEPISARFVVANYGGRAKNVIIRLYGDLDGESKTIQMTIPRVSRISSSTPDLNAVSKLKKAHNQANIGIEVDGIRRPLNLKIENIVEVDGVQIGNIRVSEGTADVEVTVLNPSTLLNPQAHELELKIGGQDLSVKKIVPALNSKEQRKVIFSLSGLDPLVLLDSGVQAEVVARMSNEVLDSGSAVRPVENRNFEISQYFDQVVLSLESLATPFIPKGVDPKLRLQSVQQLIYKETATTAQNRDIVNDNPWKNNLDSTLLGQIGQRYSTHNPQSGDYKGRYQALSNMLWPLRLSMDNDSIFKSARDSFANSIRAFGPEVKGKNKKDTGN
jgi:hypothetical protein